MAIAAFPELLPDEHIFSAAIRAYRQIGLTSTDTFLRNTFGIVPDLRSPSFIFPKGEWHIITAVSHLLKGNPWELALLHTNLPYFFNVLDTNTQIQLSQNYTHADKLKYKLAPHNNVRALANWRWCPDCAKEDFATWGNTYWHTSHQLNGMIHCSKHRTTLLLEKCSSCGNAQQTLRNAALPDPDGNCENCGSAVTPSTIESLHLHQLEYELLHWLEIPPGKFSADTLRQCYVVDVRTKRRLNFGSITPVGNAALCTINKSLEPRFGASCGLPTLEKLANHFERLGETRTRDISLHRLLTSKDIIIHPLLHILVIRFLFNTIDKFIDEQRVLKLTGRQLTIRRC